MNRGVWLSGIGERNNQTWEQGNDRKQSAELALGLLRGSSPPLYLSLHCSYRGEANLSLAATPRSICNLESAI